MGGRLSLSCLGAGAADDWGRYASAYAPHEASNGANHSLNATPHFTTPNFDRLAAEGALFLNALVV